MTGGTEEPTTCTVCWALVPRTMMTFHRDWHARLDEVAAAPIPHLVPAPRPAC
jgi:hypothetical protein